MIKIFFQIIIILLSSQMIKLEEIQQLEKYSEITIWGNRPFYLNIDRYSKGHKIYFELHFELDDGYSLIEKNYDLNYYESNSLSIPENYKVSNSYQSSYSDNHIYIPNKYTFWFSIELTGSYKYLLLTIPYVINQEEKIVSGSFTIKHLNYDYDENNYSDTPKDNNSFDKIDFIFIFVIIFVIIIVVVVTIFIYRQIKRNIKDIQLNYSHQNDDDFSSNNNVSQAKIGNTLENIMIERSAQSPIYDSTN